MKVNISDYRKDGSRDVSVEVSSHDTYSLDYTLVQIILPCLLKYKEEASRLIDMEKDNFEKDLDKIIRAFQLMEEGSYFMDKDLEREVEEGLNLFAKRFTHLWW